MDFETVIMLSLRDLNYDNIDHPLTEREIKLRYRDLAMKFHPDKQIFSDDSWMIKINNAKDFLINHLDKVNEFIYAKNPSILREEAIKKEEAKEAFKRAEEEKKAREEKERKMREEEERKRREQERQERLKKEQEERRIREEQERKRREAWLKAEAKRKEEEKKRLEEEKRKFEEWYASLTDKERKKYDKEQIKNKKKEKKMLFLKQHPNFYKNIIGTIVFVSLVIGISVVLFWRFNLYPQPYYNKGLNLYENKDYALAMEQFKKAGNYKDAKTYIKRAQAEALVLEGKNHEAGFLFGSIYKDEDYKRSKELLWKDFVIEQSIAMSSDYMVAIQKDKLIGMELNRKEHTYTEFEQWENMVYLAMTEDSIIGLDSNGKVKVDGSGSLRKKVSGWKNIVQIYTTGNIVFGLRADGKILHTSSRNHTVLKEIKKWEYVVNFDIQESVYTPYDNSGTIYYYYACGVFADGSAKYLDNENAYTEIIATWEDIKMVSLSYGDWIGVHIVGLKKDNTVVACGTNYNGVLNVTTWKNVIQVHTLSTYTFGLKKDGTIVLAGSDAFSKKDVSNILNARYMPKINNLMVVDKTGSLQCEKGKTLAMAEWKDIRVPNIPFR